MQRYNRIGTRARLLICVGSNQPTYNRFLRPRQPVSTSQQLVLIQRKLVVNPDSRFQTQIAGMRLRPGYSFTTQTAGILKLKLTILRTRQSIFFNTGSKFQENSDSSRQLKTLAVGFKVKTSCSISIQWTVQTPSSKIQDPLSWFNSQSVVFQEPESGFNTQTTSNIHKNPCCLFGGFLDNRFETPAVQSV